MAVDTRCAQVVTQPSRDLLIHARPLMDEVNVVGALCTQVSAARRPFFEVRIFTCRVIADR
jgi:hypothetical protein